MKSSIKVKMISLEIEGDAATAIHALGTFVETLLASSNQPPPSPPAQRIRTRKPKK